MINHVEHVETGRAHRPAQRRLGGPQFIAAAVVVVCSSSYELELKSGIGKFI